jgi:ATP adenylyltransferase
VVNEIERKIGETAMLPLEPGHRGEIEKLLQSSQFTLKDNITVDYLWTPWRMKYIQENNKNQDCVFCVAAGDTDGEENLIFHRGRNAFMILNRYPYTSGHVMCVPFAHVSRPDGLPPEVRAEMMELVNQTLLVLEAVYHPEGFNVGMNLGEAAGAGVADHLHMHIVPRWGGDTNFMSTFGGTRVLPESLPDTYRRIRTVWDEMYAS